MPEEMEQKKRRTHWFHIPAQLVVLGFIVYWHFHLPAPNKAVLILTGVTVVMALLDMRPSHKAIYLLLVIALIFIENRAINKDHEDMVKAEGERRKVEDDRRKEENSKFNGIVDGLNAAIKNSDKQFRATMSRFNATIDRVEDSIKSQTGGDSFAYITFTPEPAYVKFNGFSNPSGPWFLIAITSHGKYPLREIRATMMDDARIKAALEEFKKNPEGDMINVIQSRTTNYQYPYLRPQSPQAPSGDVQVLGSYPMLQGNSDKLRIAFSSLNGYWNEVLHLGLVNGMWHQCLSVMGPTVKQVFKPFIYCDSDWPEGKALAEKDWVPIKPLPKKQSGEK